MGKLTLNIYDDVGNLARVAESHAMPRLKFGIIRKIMALLDINEDTTSFDLLKSVYGAWNELQKILEQVFPDVTDDEWNNVDISELVPVLLGIAKNSIVKMNTIPTDPKNMLGA